MSTVVTPQDVEKAIHRAIALVSVLVPSGEGARFVSIGEVTPNQDVIVTYRDYEEMAERVYAELKNCDYLDCTFDASAVVGRIMRGWSARLRSGSKTYRTNAIATEIYGHLCGIGILVDHLESQQ